MSNENVIAFKDDTFLILHAKDRFNGITVQLYAFIETRRQEADGKIVSLGKQPKLLTERAVSFFKYGGGNRPAPTAATEAERKALLDPDSFRSAVLAAESAIRVQMESVYRRMEHMADGVLNDLRSKYKGLNGDNGASQV